MALGTYETRWQAEYARSGDEPLHRENFGEGGALVGSAIAYFNNLLDNAITFGKETLAGSENRYTVNEAHGVLPNTWQEFKNFWHTRGFVEKLQTAISIPGQVLKDLAILLGAGSSSKNHVVEASPA